MISIPIESRRGRAALMVAHCAGMVDLVALPVWVGTLIAHYRFDPQQAGLLATLFLAGAVLASVLLAPRFHRLNGRMVATLGFAASATGFVLAAGSTGFGTLALLHGLSGVATGAALSMTHGTIACSARPHRLFAMANAALGVFAVIFYAVVPQSLATAGGAALFAAFAIVMLVATLGSLVAFPSPPARPQAARAAARLTKPVWCGIVGIACMALVQAMIFSFLERAGSDRGFGASAVGGVLVALSLVNLLPAPLAALLERRLRARSVLLAGPVLQALLAAVIMNAPAFAAYAAAASVFAAVVIFTHTFAFGLLARLEPSGRALAATPAMMMAGAAIGPLLGGTIVKAAGYGSLALAATALAAIAVFCFSRLPTPAQTTAQEALA
ncbi:MAG: MFS transporter [Pseudomonadota bacterium]